VAKKSENAVTRLNLIDHSCVATQFGAVFNHRLHQVFAANCALLSKMAGAGHFCG
jgi:hypothetical protein